MEKASAALLERDYLTCELYAERALTEARRLESWDDYARILMPLQESRRQRRMIAAEGWMIFGPERVQTVLDSLAASGPAPGPKPYSSAGKQPGEIYAAQIVVTAPLGAPEARQIWKEAVRRRLWIEVLLAEGSGPSRTVRSWRDREIAASITAPEGCPIGSWLEPEQAVSQGKTSISPSAWFQDAAETLGDAAVAMQAERSSSVAKLDRLAQAIDAVPDHEILHQRLADVARDLHRLGDLSDSSPS